MKKLFLFNLLLMVFCSITQAQLPAVANKQLLHLVENKKSIPGIMKVVDSFYREKLLNKVYDRDYIKWNRWLIDMMRTAGPGGTFGDINKNLISEWNKTSQDSVLPNTTLSNWVFTVPFVSSYVGGVASGFNGLGRCDRIAFHPTDPNIIYVGTPMGGLWRTMNGGSSWAPLTSYLPVQGVSGIAIQNNNPNIIHILTGNGDDVYAGGPEPNAFTSAGIYKTTDGGITWQNLTLPWPETIGVGAYQIAQAPRNPNVLLVATSNGLYYTNNGGNNWIKSLNGKVDDVQFVPGTDTCYASLPGPFPVRRSVNRGFSFSVVPFFSATTPATPIDSLPSRTALAVSKSLVTPGGFENVYLFCGPVFAPGDCNGLFKMTVGSGYFMKRVRRNPNLFGAAVGGGDNFNQSGYDICAAVHPTNFNIMVTGGAVVYRTDDGGLTMPQATFYEETQTSGDLTRYIHPDIHGLAFNPLNNYLYAATDGGVYVSTNNGVNWANITNGITTSMLYDISGFEGNINSMMGSFQDNGTKYKETATNDMLHMTCCDGFNSQISPSLASRAYASANGWIARFDALPSITPTGIDPPIGMGAWSWRMNTDKVDGDYVYASHFNTDSIWVSNNAGAGWAMRRNANGNRAIVTCPSNLNRVYACGSAPIWDFNTSTLKRSDDKGNTWTANLLLNPTLPTLAEAAPMDVEVNPLNSLDVWITYSGLVAGKKVYFSNNGGVSWTNVSYNLPNVPVNTIAIDDGNIAYAGTDYGVYYKAAGSTTWIYFSNNLPRVPVKDLYLNRTNNVLFAATYGRGIWRINAYDGICDNFLFFSATHAGENSYEANVIWSSADVAGTDQTRVIYKAVDSIKLLNGFFTHDSIKEFKATLSPCGTGYPPLTNIKDTTKIDVKKLTLPVGQTRVYPYGTIRINQISKTKLQTEIQIIQSGTYELRLTDISGNLLAKLLPPIHMQPQTQQRDIALPPLPKGMYYVHLIKEGMLVHFQEVNME